MVTVRRLVVLALAATALSAPAAGAKPVPVLAGTTYLTASRPAAVDVVVPRDARVATPFGPTPDVTATGTGRVTTFVLVGTERRTASLTFAGGAAPDGVTFFLPVPQFPAPGGSAFDNVKTFGNVTTVPAGRYRLYVIPDGAPARITLRLQGLPGRTTVAPSAPVRAAVLSDVSATPDEAPAVATYVPQSLTGRGLALQVLYGRMEATAAWQLVMCHDNPRDDDVAVWQSPGCPGGDSHTFADHRFPEAEPDAKQFVQGFAGLPPGDHAVSTVFASQGVTTALRYAAVWLTY